MRDPFSLGNKTGRLSRRLTSIIVVQGALRATMRHGGLLCGWEHINHTYNAAFSALAPSLIPDGKESADPTLTHSRRERL